MTVEELIEELKAMPPTAIVFVQTRDYGEASWYELSDKAIESIVYDLGNVSVRIEE